MNKRAAFDIGALSWVQGEIDASMARALAALRAYARDNSDGANIGLARAQLHQAHGALSIVGLDGVTRVAEELEALLADLERGALARTPEIFALAARAFEALASYLDALGSGSDDQPLRLYALYRELVQARGHGPANPVDLYFPDLSFCPPRREKIPVVLRAEDEERYFHDQRARFQRGMLKWLRQDPLGVVEMRAAVEAIEAVQGPTGQRAFWWVVLAFFDALERSVLSAEVDPRRICNRIEQQIRRRLEGSHNIAERLLREMLYCVAHAKPESEHLRLVQETCGLRRILPAEESTANLPAAAPATPKAAREALAQAMGTWNQYASRHAQSLPAFQTAAMALKDLSAELGNADLTALTREIAALADWLAANPTNMSEAIALEVATALLLLENALGNPAALGADFARQSRFVRGRMKACMQGNLLRTAPPIPLLDEMSRKAQERLVNHQLVAEIQANLGRIEQVLDAFFRDSSRRAELATLELPVNQVKGALQMLGEARARDALVDCGAQIWRIAQPEYSPRQNDFERIAQILSGLGFYIEALARGKADFDEAMRPIDASGLETTPAASEQAITVEAELQQQKRETEKLYEQWKKPIDAGTQTVDAEILAVYLEEATELLTAVGASLREWRANPRETTLGQGLQRMLHTLKGSARMAGAMALGELTHDMETRVENALALGSPPSSWFDDMEVSTDRLSQLCRRLVGPAEPKALPLASSSASAVGEERLPHAAPVAQREPLLPPAMLKVRADLVDRLTNEAGEVAITRSRIKGATRALRTAMQELTDNVVRLRSELREIELQADSRMQSGLTDAPVADHAFNPLELDRFTRFQELSRLMAESVADVQSVNQTLIDVLDRTDAALAAQARLNRDLQQGLKRLRMVPFSILTERLYRIVRQTANESGRRADLDIRGAQVELERSVLERMTPVFEHLIRNAIIHGIEPSAERLAKGKSEIGEVRIDVAQEGNEVLFAVADDGRGLDIPSIREVALAKDLMGEGVILPEADIADFIFLHGFTTATEVTQVAGRGLGMEVVRTEVSSLGGRIELKFECDRGTRFVIHLPLTLAVTQPLLVRARPRFDT